MRVLIPEESLNQLNDLKQNIDETIRAVGGYWSPLSGLARVLEELGELAECIFKKHPSSKFNEELADVLIITICIANQYCAKFNRSSYFLISNKTSITKMYMELVSDCGELGRILNYYEGNKSLKASEDPATIEEQINIICQKILSISRQKNIDIIKIANQKLSKVKKRDKERFRMLYDPSQSPSHDEYIKRNKNIKVWGLQDTNKYTLEENLINNHNTIKRFLKFGRREGIESLVIKVPKNGYISKNLGKYKNELDILFSSGFAILTNKKTKR